MAAARSRRGFTLIELMAVIVIIAILVALIFSVGLYLRHDSGNKVTLATLDILSVAIEAFHAETGKMPEEANVSGAATEIEAAITRSKYLGAQLLSARSSNERLIHLPQDAIRSHPTNGKLEPSQFLCFQDGFERPIDYRKEKGMGGAPMLISAGPDGKFGYTKSPPGGDAWWFSSSPTDDEANAQKDNIQK